MDHHNDDDDGNNTEWMQASFTYVIMAILVILYCYFYVFSLSHTEQTLRTTLLDFFAQKLANLLPFCVNTILLAYRNKLSIFVRIALVCKPVFHRSPMTTTTTVEISVTDAAVTTDLQCRQPLCSVTEVRRVLITGVVATNQEESWFSFR